jgi:SOS-response transcriptional repressor LexA
VIGAIGAILGWRRAEERAVHLPRGRIGDAEAALAPAQCRKPLWPGDRFGRRRPEKCLKRFFTGDLIEHKAYDAFCTHIMQVQTARTGEIFMDTDKEVAERLRAAREAAGLETAKAAADAIGIPVATYTQHENGIRGLPAGKAKLYARAFATTPEWLLYGRGSATATEGPDAASAPRRVPVRGSVQAGAWSEVGVEEAPVDWTYFEAKEYQRAQLFALDVRGPSMNRVFPDGSRVICALPHEAGVRDGDYVAVRRTRGGLTETTLKQLVVEKSGEILLYPRSTDPAHQAALKLERFPESQEGPEIIGVVVGRTETVRAGRGPLLDLAND